MKRYILCHTEALAEVSKNTLYYHTELSQESEVSISAKYVLIFLCGYFAFAQYDKEYNTSL